MKVEQLTFTRFIAAILVIFFHHFRETTLFQNANVFVSYFYILSGFVLVISQKQEFVAKKEYYTFYLNRVARIYPIYLLAILLLVIVTDKANLDLMLSVFGIQSFFPHKALTYNSPGWSISVEFFFYLCFPFLMRFFYNKYSIKVVLILTIAFWCICQILFSLLYYSEGYAQSVEAQRFLMYNPINHMNEFICGGAAAMLYKRKHKEWQGNYDLVLVLLATLLLAYLSFLKTFFNGFDHNGLLMVLFIPIILLLALNTGYITRLFKKRIMVLAGEISFGLYILAEPVLMWLAKFSVTFSLPKVSYFHYSIVELIVFSYLAYLFIERPAQKVIKHLGHKFIDSLKLWQPIKIKGLKSLIEGSIKPEPVITK